MKNINNQVVCLTILAEFVSFARQCYTAYVTSLMDLKQTALHETHLALGAKMMPFAGFDMPVRYGSGLEEHLTVRKSVGIFDVSHMGEFKVIGEQALDLIQLITSNDAGKLDIGQAQYTCMPNHEGGIVDDLLVYRLEKNSYMLVVNASNIQKDWKWINSQNGFDCKLEDVSHQICLLALQGPLAGDTLQKLTKTDLGHMAYYTFEKGTVAGVPDVIISATGYTGSGGYELYLPTHSAKKVWDEIMNAGKVYGILPIGLGARDTLRLEKGFCLYGNDIDDTTTPLEAGLGWITKFSKEFIGREVLLTQKERGITRKLVGFLMEDRGIPRQGYEIKDSAGKVIGQVTSGSQSPSLSKGVGLGYVTKDFSSPESEIYIDIRNKNLRASVKKLPFI